jgi:hypothetical protein
MSNVFYSLEIFSEHNTLYFTQLKVNKRYTLTKQYRVSEYKSFTGHPSQSITVADIKPFLTVCETLTRIGIAERGNERDSNDSNT